jgi:uncharacterized protein YecT (DUF1311 family)
MNLKTIITVLGIALLLSACTSLQAEHSVSLPEWSPDINQPIQQLEETLATLEQQQPRNYTISNVAFLYDAKLYILFNEFVGRRPSVMRAGEVAEQRQWLIRRKELIDAAYAVYEGGTLASFNAGQAAIDATKERIVVIEQKIKRASSKPFDRMR